MLVYTLTNNITGDVWVGTCKDSSDERFMQLQEAMALGIKAQIYKDLRDFGVQNFTVEDYAVAYDRDELKDIFDEAMEIHNGKSLTGVKTTLGKTSIAKVAPLKSSVSSAAKRKTLSTTSIEPKRAASPLINEKIASGRTGNAKKEKLIKERLAEEKAEREASKLKQIREQADEMAAIMARLDSRGSTVNKRR